MAKRATRKKKRTARGKSQKNTSPRGPQNRDRGAQPKTKEKAPAEAAPHVPDAQPNEKEHKKQVEQPFIVRAQVKFIFLVMSIVIEAAVVWLWSRSVSHTRGVGGAAKVASVTILPIIAVMYAIEMTKRGFTRASALGKTARIKGMSLSFVILLVLPGLWRKIGYEDICWHTFLGGAIGFVIAFLSWLYLAAKRDPWLMQRQYGQWVWVYRFSASVLIIVGGWIGVIVS